MMHPQRLPSPAFARAMLPTLLAAMAASLAQAEEVPSPAAPSAAAAIPSGRDILQKMTDAWDITDAKSTTVMTITGAKGESRQRTLTGYQKKGADGLRKMMMRFEAPADVRGTGFLSVERGGGEEDQFLYFPALRKTKRIASSQRGDKFMSSDFSYEDLQPRDLDDGEHLWLRREDVMGVACDVVESKVKDADSQYSNLEIWVRSDNRLPLQMKLYDREGRLLKHLKMLKFEEVDGRTVVTRMKMENVQEGTWTEMAIQEIHLNQGLDDGLFTQRGLEAPLP